jgi:DNA-binding HxlR family transcriptional regulator
MSKHPLYNTTGLQKDNKSHVLYALADKQMELQQLKEEYNKKIAKIKSDLLALEHTICLFDSDCDETITKITQKVSRGSYKKRNSFFERGEAKKFILTALRTAKKPLKTIDVTLSCQRTKNISTEDREINKAVGKIIVETLRQLEKNKLVEAVGKDGLSLIWKIKD